MPIQIPLYSIQEITNDPRIMDAAHLPADQVYKDMAFLNVLKRSLWAAVCPNVDDHPDCGCAGFAWDIQQLDLLRPDIYAAIRALAEALLLKASLNGLNACPIPAPPRRRPQPI